MVDGMLIYFEGLKHLGFGEAESGHEAVGICNEG